MALLSAFNFLFKKWTWRIFRIVYWVFMSDSNDYPLQNVKSKQAKERTHARKNGFVPRHGTNWKMGKRCGENQGNQFQIFPRATASIASVCVALAGMVPGVLQPSPVDPQVCGCETHSGSTPDTLVPCLAVPWASLGQGTEWQLWQLTVPALLLLPLRLATGTSTLWRWQPKEPPGSGQRLFYLTLYR